jgi:hypothetical protein
MTAVPIQLFNYLAFIIPTTIFCLLYIVSLYHSVRLYIRNSKNISVTE